jgi:membrane-bound lytic murein transglycosylase D
VIPSAGRPGLRRGIALRRALLLGALALLTRAAAALTADAVATPSELATPATASAPAELFPRPVELQPDINFWIRVYSEIATTEGFIHDQRNLAVVYEKLKLPAQLSPKERQALVDAARDRYIAVLKYLATGASARDAEEQRVRDLWPAATAASRLALAADEVRFQLGQSDRFKAGLIRAGAWEAHIANTIAAQGLPAELAALPHVESSFNPEAYSKVGAAGLWQFMRPTGRLYLRIDSSVDERMDPFRASEAAAQLLAYNYRVLGTWPLALTAYNHGSEGMRRARDSLGTTDIVKILREYNSPLFGFASRNFYVSFLAALSIDRDPRKYFGALQTEAPQKFQEFALPAATRMAAIEKAVGLAGETLRAINPALRDPVWSGARPVPAGYRLRLPATGLKWSAAVLASRLKGTANDQTLTAATATATPVSPPLTPARPTVPAVAAAITRTPAAAAATVAAVEALPAAAADATDLAVADNNTIVIAAGETLGHYADWLGVSAAHLRTLNRMSFHAALPIGRRLALDFGRVGRGQFEQRRRAYREQLQADYFATRRIVGTETYQTRSGDSLWVVTQKFSGMPTWLLQQYNPDVDFNILRPGTILVLPKVETRPDV